MNIFINDVPLGEPTLVYDMMYPAPPTDEEETVGEAPMIEDKLDDGTEVKYRYAFTKGTIHSAQLRVSQFMFAVRPHRLPPFTSM